MALEAATILVVEDDRTLARGLVMNLEIEGFRVLHAAQGDLGLRLALDEQPDLIVLDLMLPGLSGFEVVRALRDRSRFTPVLILSARGEVEDKIRALGLGADDYLTKPFSLKELVARVHAGLRRPSWKSDEDDQVRFADVEVALTQRKVWRGGEEVSLTSREFDLLRFLLARQARIFSREQLLAAVWNYDYEGTARTVDNFMRRLRVKLELDPENPRHLVTVRGSGYKFDP